MLGRQSGNTHSSDSDTNSSQLDADEQHEAHRRRNALLLPGGVSSGGGLVIMFWQLAMIERYGKAFPSSIFTGEHQPLNESCSELFSVTSQSFFCALLMLMLDLGMACAVMLVADVERKYPTVVGIVRGFEAGLGFVKVYVTFLGLFVLLFQVREGETRECKALYTCTWWCFIGLGLVTLCLFCCLILLAPALRDRQRDDNNSGELQGLLRENQLPAYGSGPRRAEVVPFTGIGRRLSADCSSQATEEEEGEGSAADCRGQVASSVVIADAAVPRVSPAEP